MRIDLINPQPGGVDAPVRETPVFQAIVFLKIALVAMLGWTPGIAHDTKSDSESSVIVNSVSEDAQCHFPDSALVTSSGKSVQFYEDLVKDKVVAINFIFTDCTTVCSPAAIKMSHLEQMLKQRDASDVGLISVSIDPVTDTPERLSEWSDRFNPGPDWTFLTGEKRTVDDLLRALKVFTPNYEDHQPIMIVANDATQSCRYVNGLSSAKFMLQAIDRIL
ncbi:MAG: redoxin family protein [Gammaproteobacteria bacterium]|nr:redoxin family protein [Gammaproteobacteria bacterium]